MVILTVEDEFALSELLGEMLGDAGYDVVAAHSADEAIALLEADQHFALVITDIDMPGTMNGLRLAAAVRDRWPPVRIIVTSGKGRPTRDEMPAGSAFVPKPYDTRAIIEAVHAVC